MNGPTPIFDEIEQDTLRAAHAAAGWFTRHHDTSAAQPAATATIQLEPQEEPVSLSSDLHAFAAKLEGLGEDGVEVLQRVKANPETAKALGALDELTGLNVAPGLIDILSAGLGELVNRLKAAATQAPDAPPAPVQTGPVTAGQAQ